MLQRWTTVSLWIGTLLILFLAGCDSLPQKTEPDVATAFSEDGSPIRYEVSVCGEPTLVFIHCWTCDREFWRLQIEYFQRTHQVVSLDLAGHGESGSKRQDYSMEAFGEDVVAVVESIDADEVILIGHSMGGPVAIEAAGLLGDKVIGIVGVDTFYTGFVYPKNQNEVEAFVDPFKKDFQGSSRQMVGSLFTPDADPKVVEFVLARVGDPQRQPMAISAIYESFAWNAGQAPTLLDKYADKLRNINGAPTGREKPLHQSVTLIPYAGHFIPQEAPDEFNKVLELLIAEFQAM